MKTLIYALFLYLSASTVNATPLYIDKINLANIDEKKLEETHKQIKELSEIKLKDNLFVSPFHKQNKKRKNRQRLIL